MIPSHRSRGDILAEDAQLRAIARQGRDEEAHIPSISELPPEVRAEIYEHQREHALQLAREAADRASPRKRPLTRARALKQAGDAWRALQGGPLGRYAESGIAMQRPWCAAYADRLIERGLALPSSTGRSGPSGSSGGHASPRMTLSASTEQLRAWDAAAKRAGLDRSTWIRRELDAAALK
jgi:hypothetical protein